MDVANLAKELADLQYETGYRFENGQAFRARLSEAEAAGLLAALRQRGYAVVRDTPPHVDSPRLYAGGRLEHEQAG